MIKLTMLPIELVDIIIDHSYEINARSTMTDKVLPELLMTVPMFMSERCIDCSDEGRMCIGCAHEYGYVSGPGYYCGRRYVISDLLSEDMLYFNNLIDWQKRTGLDYYLGGDPDEDIYGLRLQYESEKYRSGSLGHMLFVSRQMGMSDLIDDLIDMYNMIDSNTWVDDSENILEFCKYRDLGEDYYYILNLWKVCMYD